MLSASAQIPAQVGKSNESTRFAWVEQALAEVPPGWRLLDAGAGERRYRSACSHLDYVSQDFARYDGGGDGSGLQTGVWDQRDLDIVSDITAIPEPDASFDAVLCVEVFEHIPDPIAALREFARLVRPGGRLILTAPFCSFTHFAPYHFATGLSRYWYRHHLPANGFEVRSIEPNGNYFKFLSQEARRLRSVAQRYANGAFDEHEREAIQTLLAALERFSRDDRGSDELLCFGFHVIAERVSYQENVAAQCG
jgi:ubiquinone/menaquinone biosynthesis C-methylase UbiE